MAARPCILFIHDNYPAQFGGIGDWLAKDGWQVTFATAAGDARSDAMRVLTYTPHRAPGAGTHPYAQPMDRAAINGQGFVRMAITARDRGLDPDVIVAHSGWGAGMFARDVFPRATFVAYCEWWYQYPGIDTAFLARLWNTGPLDNPNAPMQERARNAPIAMDIAASDAAICPTQFQANQFPPVMQRALTVAHDGIDTAYYRPEPGSRHDTLNGLVVENARVVTYATRGMEPHRGFPQFMASLPAILADDPRNVVVIAGSNRVAYGSDAHRRTDWKAQALATHDLDPARVHFVGALQCDAYRALLRRSDAHVYLTVPFVLSWSMLEAMSTGCALVVSDTEPVREFAGPDAASLVDLGDPAGIAGAVIDTLRDSAKSSVRRQAARAVITSLYGIDKLYPQKAAQFKALCAAPRQPSAALFGVPLRSFHDLEFDFGSKKRI